MQPIEYIAVTGLFKARAAEEAGQRVLYMEASNEAADIQGERVMAKSLRDSADHFLKYGNIDLDHRTLRPPQGAGDNPYLWEIGRPVQVDADGDKTMVKAVLYQGDGDAARNANYVWDSLTRTQPPARWYPSVGGQILHREPEIDPRTQAKVNLITKVRWTNIGLSRTPVNTAVPPVSVVSAEVFAKCCTAGGFDLAKALEAGYGTDVAALEGGASLRLQSLDHRPQATVPVTYADVREGLARYIRSRPGGPLTQARLQQVAIESLGVPPEAAARWARRFLRDVRLFRRNP